MRSILTSIRPLRSTYLKNKLPAFGSNQLSCYYQSNRSFSKVVDDLLEQKQALSVDMPDVMDAKVTELYHTLHSLLFIHPCVSFQEGKVTKWLKSEGETFHVGEYLCQISIAGLEIALECQHYGIVMEKLVNEGQIIEVGEPIIAYAPTPEAYAQYIDHKRIVAEEAIMAEEAMELQAEAKEKSKKPTNLVLMREIKHLIQDGDIEEGSGEFVSFRLPIICDLMVFNLFT
jgi:biotin carboxyl carrier protein